MKKPLPTITWQNIAPPYYEYTYFQDCEQYPFHPRAEQFDLVNAWRLSEIATLVYADEEFVRLQCARAGWPDVKYFCGASTDCFVVSNHTTVIVAFRGTESRKRESAENFQHVIADVKADSNILLVKHKPGGRVHKGFHDALVEVWGELLRYIRRLHTPARSLWITGHSLGAALATLTAARYPHVQGVYTFGSPRVGDVAFKQSYSAKTYRVVNNNDIITALPPPGLYRHVGELWYIDSEGQLQHNARRFELWKDGIRGELRNITNTLEHVKAGDFIYIPGGIKDHVPHLYAVHLGNMLAERSAAE